MTTLTNPAPKPRSSGRRPQIVIDAAQLGHLEDLAYGAETRQPELAALLLTELARAKIVPTEKMPADIITIGRPVTWRDEAADRTQTGTLVWPEEADIAAGRISILTPIGVALLGLKAGAAFDWTTRNGETRALSVLSVGEA